MFRHKNAIITFLLATALLTACTAEGGASGPALANPEPTKPVARENPPAALPESPPPDRTAAAVPAKEKAPGLPAARVTRVVDGDTIHVAMNGRDETVRLIGVDTPETVHPEKPVEPYGPEASNFTKSKLNGKTVYLEFDVQERDKYGRLLAYVWLDEPGEITDAEIRKKMFNAVLLLEGYAQLLTVPPNVKYADHFVRYQREAREAGKGLWGLEPDEPTPARPDTPQPNAPSSGAVQGTGGYDCPEGYPVKGNINSKGEKIYHVPGGQFYDKTKPEMCFKTPEDAEKSGFSGIKEVIKMHRITGPDLPQNALLQLRTCPVCGKNIAAVVKSFASKDEALAWLDDDADREDFPVLSLPCPECDPPDAERYATHSIFIVGGEVVGEPIELGTASVPVVVRPDDPAALLYSATVDEDEGRRLDAANLTFAKYPPAVFDGFVRAYIRDTLHFRRFDDVIKAWPRERWETAFSELGLTPPGDGRYRKTAREHAEAVLEWHMRGLIRRVQYTTLAVFGERGYRDYDAWTVQYFVLHVPLPEDLEPVRTELIGRFVSRPDHGSEALFRRLRELQGQLDEQRRKVGELRARLDEARRKEAELQRKLSEAYERIRTLEARLSAETIVAATPRPEDRRRHRYKALIAALRADVERLEAALRKAGVREEIVVEEETPPPAETVVDVEAALAGKTILVVGGDRAPETEKPVRILHHPGYTKEGLEHLINMADVVAIVTRHISHGLFWYVRDEALERDKPVVYTTHTNGDLILRAVAGRILSGR